MLGYSELREIQKKEMESSSLCPIGETFYEMISELLKIKKEEAVKKNSLSAIKEYENIKKIVVSIQNKREEKIAIMAIRGSIESPNLCSLERKVLDELSGIFSKGRKEINEIWDSDETVSSNNNLSRKLRILSDLGQYKGIDNQVYGPFKKGQEVSIPEAEAEWMIKSKIAELL